MTAPLRRRRPEARPEEILAAALDVFTLTGFASARVEDIARRAGLSKGAVYLYFPSKEAMLEALVEQSAARVADALSDLAEAGAEVDPEVALRTGLRMALSTLSQPEISAAPRLILAEAARFPDLAYFYRQRVINVGQAALIRILTAGMEQGVFRTVQTPVALRAFMGPVLAHVLVTTLFAQEGDPELEPAELADQLADLLFHGLKPAPPHHRER